MTMINGDVVMVVETHPDSWTVAQAKARLSEVIEKARRERDAAVASLEAEHRRLSEEVAALEERLGARLLQRTTRSVTLTDAGARYLERARRILADVEEAELAAEAERIRPSGRL
ncbi:hypothetical protein LTR94_029840, partial [Friedmanniomyces endolithicus]